MKLKSLKLKNYRQYKDVQIIFSDPQNKAMITVLEGANGAGKTNILNAITWCLYGQEMHISIKDKGLPIINNITLSELEIGKYAMVEVTLVTEDNIGNLASFNRRLDTLKTKDNVKESLPSTLRVAFKSSDSKDWSISKEPELRAEKLLPRNIQEYFFFDGERLNKYFISGPRKEIKNEVFQISQLNYFDQVIDHFEKLGADYAKEVSLVSPKIEDINDKIKRKKIALDSTNNEIKNLESKAQEAREEEEKLFEEVQKLPISGAKVKELRTKGQSIEKILTNTEDELRELRQERTNNLIEYSKIIYSYEFLIKAKSMLENKVERGEIPPEFKTKFIERLLEQGECICGTKIKDGVPRDKVETLLKQCSALDEISHELIKEAHNLSMLINKAKDFRPRISKIEKMLQSKDKGYIVLSEQLKEIQEQIDGIDDEKVQKIENRYRIIRKEKEEYLDQIGMKKQYIKSLKYEIDQLQEEYHRELRKVHKHDDLKSKIQFCINSTEAAKRVMKEVMEEIRAEIEERTNKQFFATIWKQDTYQKVKIDNDYNISVYDINGMESIGTLSAGERQLLALAFTEAVHTVSGFDMPLLIDTPLGRISGAPRLNLAKELPNLNDNKQIIFLMTDQEYTKEVRDVLRKHIDKEYLLKYIETDLGAKVEVVPYEEKA